jgi:large subunit ribosomal protein L6
MMMSRIGKLPIEIPEGVDLSIEGQLVTVKGSKGTLKRVVRPECLLEHEGRVLRVVAASDERQARAYQGLTRTLIANMVQGVSKGYDKQLELVGVGYRAQSQGKKLVLQLGYSHPVEIDLPDGIDVKVDANTKLTVSGYDKQLVGDISALIRSKRPPEPYKGKGVRYSTEVIRKKAGKSGKK